MLLLLHCISLSSHTASLSSLVTPHLHSPTKPVGIVARVLLHAAEGVPFPVQPVSQE